MIALILAVATNVTPVRDALIARWLQADRTHTSARLNAAPSSRKGGTIDEKTTSANLQTLLRHELATSGRYQLTHAPPEVEPWWVRPWRWLLDRWERLWKAMFGRIHVSSQTAARIGDGVLVLLGLLLIFVALRLLANLQRARDPSSTPSVSLRAPPSPRALYRAACAAADMGNYGAAILLLFAATVALLERRGDVEPTPSATVGDLRRKLRARDAGLVAPFDAVASPFVQHAYAERNVDQREWQRARDAFDRLFVPSQAVLEG